MNTILLFFVLPIATIILAIVLEKILRCPILTAATFFAIFLILAFTVFDETFLIFVIAYTIIAFITAVIAEFFFRKCCNEEHNKDSCFCNILKCNNSNRTLRLSESDINAIARQIVNNQNNANNCECSGNSCNQNQLDTVNVSVRNPQNGNRTSWCCYRK